MARARFPILEHDPDPTALISPRPRKGRKGAPPCVVLCFFLEVIEEVCGQERAEEVTAFEWEHGRHPLPPVSRSATWWCLPPRSATRAPRTDAPYRETRSRISRRQEEGCVTVEMETAALAAVARFRQVSFGQYLYAGDDVSGEAWDHRGWNTHSSRRDLFWLAVEAATRLGGASARGS